MRHLEIRLAGDGFARGMVVRDHQRCRADVEPAAQYLADLERRLVDRPGKDLLVDEMVFGAEIEDAQLLVAGMPAAAAQIGDNRGLIADQRPLFDIRAQDMADDAVDAVEQIGEARVTGCGGERFAVGGEDRAERAVAV